ncbi:hypothetical protein JHK84_047799 [Glycine max]|nr:hypothetical protein JHK84_047799 [Glycine max]
MALTFRIFCLDLSPMMYTTYPQRHITGDQHFLVVETAQQLVRARLVGYLHPLTPYKTFTNKFLSKGLDIKDLVVLSGAHTIGYARCFTLKQRFFNYKDTGKPDPSLDASLLQHLQKLCPDNSSDTNLAPLDPVTTYTFDNMYYKNLVKNLGLLPTDEALMSDSTTASLVNKYSQWPSGMVYFYKDFDVSLEKMGLIGVLTGPQGDIRKNCRVIN